MSGISSNMEFFEIESFGPLLGILTVEREEDIQAITQRFSYGLSSAIFSRNHHRALSFAKTLNSGAVHINSMTVHDEATLPHGGWGDSGWGRFGSRWGLEEFLQTKSVVFNP
jgi:acyl-CoA reductase-like NAD-dependent aldehyde dehydrogenase